MLHGVDPWRETWTAPRLAQQALSGLEAGQSLLLQIPASVGLGSLRRGLEYRVRYQSPCGWRRLRIRSDQSLRDGMTAALMADLSSVGPIDAFVRALIQTGEWSGEVLWIEPPGPGWVEENIDQIDVFTSVAATIPGAPRLVVPYRGLLADVETYRVGRDGERSVRWGPQLTWLRWSGAVGTLDVRMRMASDRAVEAGVSHPLHRLLLSATVLEVALWDAELAERLVGAGERGATDPFGVVEAHARVRWTTLPSTRAHSEAAWLAGWWDDWDGNPCWHSGVLALQAPEELSRRIWRAHMSCLFPLLESLRPRVAREVSHLLPADLHAKRGEDFVLVDAATDLEWGGLRYYLQRSRSGRRHRAYRLIQEAQEIRNEIAHLEPVSPKLLRSGPLVDELGRFLARS
jgi:hypothetical protein